MSHSDRDRLLDVLEAAAAIDAHLARGPLSDGLVFDAVRVRLIEIGEAVKDMRSELTRRSAAHSLAAGRRDAQLVGAPLPRHLARDHRADRGR